MGPISFEIHFVARSCYFCGHGGDIALRQLVLVGEGRADDGGKLQEDAEGPDVVAPEEVWIYVDT